MMKTVNFFYIVLLISVKVDVCLSLRAINRGTQLRNERTQIKGHYQPHGINKQQSDLLKNSNFFISVHAGEPTTISSHNIAYMSSSITNENIVYIVNKQLELGQGYLVFIDNPNEQVQRFTQADVDAQKLVYIPPHEAAVPKEQIFTIDLTVIRSPDNSVMVDHQPFKIRLQPLDEGEPQFRIVNPIIQVKKMKTTGILKEYFEISGTDNYNLDLKYVITDMPKYGALILKCKNMPSLNLDGGIEFSLWQHEDCIIKYEHYDGVDIMEDMFDVLATDGYFELENSVYLEIISNGDNSSIFHETKGVTNERADSVIQFGTHIDVFRVNENTSSIHVPVQRWGDVSVESQVQCYTTQLTAMAGKDYVERPRNSFKSFLVFRPGVTILDCEVYIIDDTFYENEEEFILRLEKIQSSDEAVLGENVMITLKITDYEDMPKIEFEKEEVSVSAPETMRSGDATSTIIVNVLRSGDVSQESQVRVSTCDDSASAGIDYEPISRLLVFNPGTQILPVQIKVIHRLTRTQTQTFSLVLSSTELSGAQLGEKSSLTIKVKEGINSQTMKVLPTQPIIVSLLDYDAIHSISQRYQPSPGYPLICVSSCDNKHPHFSRTRILCESAGINETFIDYSWDVAAPRIRRTSLFRPITVSTIFGDIHNKVLDPVFFATKFQVRCVTTPFMQTAQGLKIRGISLRSNSVNIGGKHEALCPRVTDSDDYHGIDSSVAVLRYIDPSDVDKEHSNTINVHLEIPHFDGMVPLVSTLPIANPRVLLLDRKLSAQHKCSNLHNDSAFLSNKTPMPTVWDPGFNRPYQLSSELMGKETVQLYQHLNLDMCTWKFDAWFHITQLVDNCGGKITSELQIGSQGEHYVTVKVPLYVTYMSARAPVSWTAIEHRTELEVSFYYMPVLLNDGLNLKTEFEANVQITKISADEDGRMVLIFETTPQFLGRFIMSHTLLPAVKSKLVPPSGVFTNFTLELVWSEATWDQPEQEWRAISDYSLMDYSGVYTLQLIPCTVQSQQRYHRNNRMTCTPQKVIQKQFPVSFRQSTRPIPLSYKLKTHFILTNDESSFLAKPSSSQNLQDYTGVFLPDEVVYGRVLWHSSQHLHSAYSLTIERLYLCAGIDDYIPSGLQYGCLQTSPKFKHSFLLLDRENPFAVDRYHNGLEFEVQFASDIPEYGQLHDYAGVDGFTLKVDPLYQINSGYKWYLQVFYTIGAASSHRTKRSVSETEKGGSQFQNNIDIKRLRLRKPSSMETLHEFNDNDSSNILLIGILLAIIVVVMVTVISLCVQKKLSKNKGHTSKHQQRKSHASLNSFMYNGSKVKKPYSIPAVTVWNNIRGTGTEV